MADVDARQSSSQIAWTIHWTTIDGHDSNRHAMVSGPPVEHGADVRVVPASADGCRHCGHTITDGFEGVADD